MGKLNKVMGANIKRKRRELGMSQEQLAELLNCSHQLVSYYETGFCAMPIESLIQLSNYCNTPVDWFFLDKNSILVNYVALGQ